MNSGQYYLHFGCQQPVYLVTMKLPISWNRLTAVLSVLEAAKVWKHITGGFPKICDLIFFLCMYVEVYSKPRQL